MSAASIRASANYRARKAAREQRYREALEQLAQYFPADHRVTEIARKALQDNNP